MALEPSFALGALSGWGRYPVLEAREGFPPSSKEVAPFLKKPYLPRGLGRSYGDAGLPASGHEAVNASFLDRFIAFDPATGILEAEAGVSLADILRVCVPLGFFLPVTPGTKFVSLGGALASNVHGKNHHRTGSIERFVTELEVLTPLGTFICSPEKNGELFRATVGGYGLTGFITRVKLRLLPVASDKLQTARVRARNLDELFSLFTKHDGEYAYSVAWLDTLAKGSKLGRGILMLGNHAAAGGSSSHREKFTLAVPFPMPDFLMGRQLAGLFNSGFYHLSRTGTSAAENFDAFFYPLDRLLNWNLLYGQSGFFQYQCAIPDPDGEDGMAEVLSFLSENRLGSFLSVLKRCGDDEVMLPFCRRGYTLALDIPFRGSETLKLLDRLDVLVMKRGGKVYLTKDARLGPETFRAMYPEWKSWMETVRRFNPDGTVRSLMSERLGLWKAS